MQNLIESLKKIFVWIKDGNHQRFILIMALVIAIFIAFKQCESKNELKNQFEQNQYALNDTIHKMMNKLDEVFYTKAMTVSRLSELEDLNKELYDEIKKMRGTIAQISNIEAQIVYIDKPILSTLNKYPDGSYAIDWFDTTKYSYDYYRYLKGKSLFKLDSTKGAIVPENIKSILEKDSTYLKLTTGIWRNNESDKWEVFIKNSNPNIKFDLSGHVVQDEIDKITNSVDRVKWSISLHCGAGFGGPFSSEFANKAIFGYQIGIGISYSLVPLNFWPFR